MPKDLIFHTIPNRKITHTLMDYLLLDRACWDLCSEAQYQLRELYTIKRENIVSHIKEKHEYKRYFGVGVGKVIRRLYNVTYVGFLHLPVNVILEQIF